MNWNTQTSRVSKADAIAKIKDMAEEQGLSGAFKVYYDSNQIATPEDLPAEVDMRLVQVSAVLNQA